MNKKSLRKILKKILYFPTSPKVIKGGVDFFRRLGVLKNVACRKENYPFKRILISHPYTSVGDVVLVLPLVEGMRQIWPDAVIDIVVGDNMARLFEGHHELNRVFRYKASRFKQPIIRMYVRVFQIFSLYFHGIGRYSYDLVIVPRWDSDADAFIARYLAYLTNAPYRCGYSAEVDGGDLTIDTLLTHVAQGGNLEHEMLRYMRLLNRAGLTTVEMANVDSVKLPIKRMIEIANAADTSDLTLEVVRCVPYIFTKYIIISPGATNPRRIWSAEKLAQLMSMLYARYDVPFLIVGSTLDKSSCDRLAQEMSDFAISLAGKTNVQQLIAIVYGSILFIGNDSGPGHIAGALGVPTLIASPFPLSCKIDHPNAPIRFHPSGPQVKVVQPALPKSPCDPNCNMNTAHCIEQISVEEMFIAAQSLLDHILD